MAVTHSTLLLCNTHTMCQRFMTVRRQPRSIAKGGHETGCGVCQQHASRSYRAGGTVRLSPAHLPLCCYPELTVHRHACSSAHHYAIQQGDVRHVHRPQLVIQGILGSEEAAEHHTEVNARGFSTSFRQRLTCRDADGKDATVRQVRSGMKDNLGILTKMSLTSWPQHDVLSACACTLHPALLPSWQCLGSLSAS